MLLILPLHLLNRFVLIHHMATMALGVFDGFAVAGTLI
jgi:hypothetical protein